MAKTTKILLKRSTVAGKAPTASIMETGEAFVNLAEGTEHLYFKNAANKVIATKLGPIGPQLAETVNMERNCIVGSALRDYDEITPINNDTTHVSIMDNGVGGTNYAKFYRTGAAKDSWTGMYFNNVYVKPSTTYTFSVWKRSTAKTDNGCYAKFIAINGDEPNKQVNLEFPVDQSLNVWKLHKMVLTVPKGCTKLKMETAVRKNGGMDICRPMLEEGEEYMGWSLSPNDRRLDDQLTIAGIDIKGNIINAKSPRFYVKDNKNNVTVSVSGDGYLTGSMFAKNVKRVITKDNFLTYFEKDTDAALADTYKPIWGKMVPNLVIQSVPNDTNGDPVNIRFVLPTTETKASPYTDGRYERAREMVGKTIIIRCTDNNIPIWLVGTSNTAPNNNQDTALTTLYTLPDNKVAYLTCKVKNTGSENDYETIYWERVVRKALP